MKLNPPASSSDLEAAREIARRLHQRRRRADFERAGDQRVAPAPAEPLARPASALFAPAAPLARARPLEPSAPAVERRTATSHVPAPTPEPAPPSWDDDESEAEPHEHLTGALGDLDDTGAEPAEIAEAAAPIEPADDDASSSDAALSGLPGVEVEEPGVDIAEEETISPDEMVGASDDEPATGDDPFQEPLGDEFEPTLPPDEGPPADGAEEIFDETPAPPSWEEVVETCRDLAGASGAMIIDPAGQVFAAHGAWPEPGPDAIAGRLVVMMERTLKDAPTRSVSAPVGGQHLTAWRVPIAEGLLTAAFIADAPLRSDVRAAIDAEIHRGAAA
jgi:hypothetical protein